MCVCFRAHIKALYEHQEHTGGAFKIMQQRFSNKQKRIASRLARVKNACVRQPAPGIYDAESCLPLLPAIKRLISPPHLPPPVLRFPLAIFEPRGMESEIKKSNASRQSRAGCMRGAVT
jgi:hypothetical protein